MAKEVAKRGSSRINSDAPTSRAASGRSLPNTDQQPTTQPSARPPPASTEPEPAQPTTTLQAATTEPNGSGVLAGCSGTRRRSGERSELRSRSRTRSRSRSASRSRSRSSDSRPWRSGRHSTRGDFEERQRGGSEVDDRPSRRAQSDYGPPVKREDCKRLAGWSCHPLSSREAEALAEDFHVPFEKRSFEL